jgi:hypothetical protein
MTAALTHEENARCGRPHASDLVNPGNDSVRA